MSDHNNNINRNSPPRRFPKVFVHDNVTAATSDMFLNAEYPDLIKEEKDSNASTLPVLPVPSDYLVNSEKEEVINVYGPPKSICSCGTKFFFERKDLMRCLQCRKEICLRCAVSPSSRHGHECETCYQKLEDKNIYF